MNARDDGEYERNNPVPYAGGSGYQELRTNTYAELGTLSHTGEGNDGYSELDSNEREC